MRKHLDNKQQDEFDLKLVSRDSQSHTGRALIDPTEKLIKHEAFHLHIKFVFVSQMDEEVIIMIGMIVLHIYFSGGWVLFLLLWSFLTLALRM